MSGREKALAARSHAPSSGESRGRSLAVQEGASQTNLEAHYRLAHLIEDAIAARQRALERFEAHQSDRAA